MEASYVYNVPRIGYTHSSFLYHQRYTLNLWCSVQIESKTSHKFLYCGFNRRKTIDCQELYYSLFSCSTLILVISLGTSSINLVSRENESSSF